MITEADLEKAGYRESKPHKADGLWSKWIRGSFLDQDTTYVKKLYCIHVYWWDHRPYGGDTAFSAEARFYRRNQDDFFDISRSLREGDSVEKMETWFQDVWTRLECRVDPYNQE